MTENRLPIFQYYRIDDRRIEYLGCRYFRVDLTSDSVIQVCVTNGEQKKGKGHYFGLYLISRTTFFTNYLGMGYAIPTDKEEYESMKEKVLLYLS